MVGLTERELVPVPPETAVPPQLPVYQSVVKPVPGLVTEIVDEDPLHIAPGLAEIPVGVEGKGFTVIFSGFGVALAVRLPFTSTHVIL